MDLRIRKKISKLDEGTECGGKRRKGEREKKVPEDKKLEQSAR